MTEKIYLLRYKMEPLNKIIVFSLAYIMIHTDIYIEYILKKTKGSVDPMSNELTTQGEFFRFILFLFVMLLVEYVL